MIFPDKPPFRTVIFPLKTMAFLTIFPGTMGSVSSCCSGSDVNLESEIRESMMEKELGESGIFLDFPKDYWRFI
jgi:hypothetical protein